MRRDKPHVVKHNKKLNIYGNQALCHMRKAQKAEGLIIARRADLPESKPCWQEKKTERLSAAGHRTGRYTLARKGGETPSQPIWQKRRKLVMAFFNSAVTVLQTLVIALGAGLGIWGAINLLEGYGNDNPGAKSQGMKQLMAGGGVALIGTTLVPLLSGLFG
jgi:hypothetical protein